MNGKATEYTRMFCFFDWLYDCFMQPFFRVVTNKKENIGKFSLFPMRSYYYFTFVGIITTFSPLLLVNHLIPFCISLFILATILCSATINFYLFRREMTKLISCHKDNNFTYQYQRKQVLFSTALLIFLIIICISLAFLTATESNSYVFFTICCTVFIVFYMLWYPFVGIFSKYLLAIPKLEVKYNTQLSETLKEKVDIATDYRTIRNARVLLAGSSFIENFHLSGTISALFDGKNRTNIMRSSKIKPVFWFFSPVLVPLVCLLLLQPVSLFLNMYFSLNTHINKHLLIYSSCCWLIWSIYFYINKSDLELFRKDSLLDYYSVTRMADFEKVELQSLQYRRTLLNFYQNQGVLRMRILELLSLTVPPFLFAYFSLFPEYTTQYKDSNCNITVKEKSIRMENYTNLHNGFFRKHKKFEIVIKSVEDK